MRSGKRTLAGVAAAALGAALIPFVGAGVTSAAVTNVTPSGPQRAVAIFSNPAVAGDDSTVFSKVSGTSTITTTQVGQSYVFNDTITSIDIVSAPGIDVPVGALVNAYKGDDSTVFRGTVTTSYGTLFPINLIDDSFLVLTDTTGNVLRPSPTNAQAGFQYAFSGAPAPGTTGLRVPLAMGVDESTNTVYMLASNPGTYTFLVNGTFAWTMTTTGAPTTVTYTPTALSMPNVAGQTSVAKLTVQDANGRATQLAGAETITVASNDDSLSISSTQITALTVSNAEKLKTLTLNDDSLAIGANNLIFEVRAGAVPIPIVSITSSAGGTTPSFTPVVLPVTMASTATTTTQKLTAPTNAFDLETGNGQGPTPFQWYVQPGVTSLTVQSTLLGGSTSSNVFFTAWKDDTQNPANIIGTQLVTATGGVASYNLTLAPGLTDNGDKVFIFDGSTYLQVTYVNPVGYFFVVPDASVVAGKIGTDVAWNVITATQYGSILPGYTVTLTTTSGSRNPSKTITATTDATGTASVTLTDAATSATNLTDVVSISAKKDGIAAKSGDIAGSQAVAFPVTVKWSATGEVGLTSLRFNGTAAASYTTKKSVPYTGLVGAVADDTGWVAVTAVASVPGVPVTFTGSTGVLLAETANGCVDVAGTAVTSTDLAETQIVASDTTSGVATVCYQATKVGANNITVTSTSGASLTGSITSVSPGPAARNVALAAAPARQTLNVPASITVTVTDVFGNPVVLGGTGSGAVTLQTNLGTLAGGVSIFSVAATNAQGQATVTLLSEVAGKATVGAQGVGGQFGNLINVPFVGAVASKDTASTEVEFVSGPTDRSIAIVGERKTVSGKPGILVDGSTVGFDTGAKVKPWIRFPGQTSYSEGSARPTISAEGEFTWQRKTGKKSYVYFTNEDGDIRSNRVIIPAN